MSIDPRARQRVHVVPVTPTMGHSVTNAELVASFLRTWDLSDDTERNYKCHLLAAIRDFSVDGQERPVRGWTKPELKAYLLWVEENYCGHFRSFPGAKGQPRRASCRIEAFQGTMPAEAALTTCCATCDLFKATTSLRMRLHALDSWFAYLTEKGAVERNVMLEVVDEWYRRHGKPRGGGEKKRNPSVEEQVVLVNETVNPMRRALYGCSRKWGGRPNEMLRLDRFASFGLPMPEGCVTPPGFADGFPAHPGLPSFEEGGDCVYLPRKVKPNGELAPDKRKDNRWLVADPETRPLVEQAFAYWERTVKRKADGTPAHTRWFINERGEPLSEAMANEWLMEDAERLGLMKPEDRKDRRRKMTLHGQRHGQQKDLQFADVPHDWNKHLRGDAFQDARGDYYEPPPEHVRAKFLQHVPLQGYKPLPDAPSVKGRVTEAETHRAVLERELGKLTGRKGVVRQAFVALRVGGVERPVSRMVLPSVVFAFRAGGVEVAPPERAPPCEPARAREARELYVEALACLGASRGGM